MAPLNDHDKNFDFFSVVWAWFFKCTLENTLMVSFKGCFHPLCTFSDINTFI